MQLMIIESPGKIKKITSFLPTGFTVKASVGHVRDLKQKSMSVDVDNNFDPVYEILSDKRAIVRELTALAKKASCVWLATDADLEGEAIAFHLQQVLKLSSNKVKRITYNEITKDAIANAMQNPRQVDMNVVKAQQARRVVDRLLGYDISPLLWMHIKTKLSAGRVQSIALKLLVERQKEIDQHRSKKYFDLGTQFRTTGTEHCLDARYVDRVNDVDTLTAMLDDMRTAKFTIGSVLRSSESSQPPAPYTTSTLQQDAHARHGLSPKQTMFAAQKLYEQGHITYMRTDSKAMASQAMLAAKETITTLFGEADHQERHFTKTASGAQMAHECIRPCTISKRCLALDPLSSEFKLYDTIWKRTIASQMVAAEFDALTISVDYRSGFLAKTRQIVRPGWKRVYGEMKTDDRFDDFQKLYKENSRVELVSATGDEKATQPPPYYTEASLVKKLEDIGCGRPSTYASTVSLIQERSYAIKTDISAVKEKVMQIVLKRDGDRFCINKGSVSTNPSQKSGKLIPTSTGAAVMSFLEQHFGNIVDYGFTSKLETQMDAIADGQKNWTETVRSFYEAYHPTAVELRRSTTSKPNLNDKRYLGEHPRSKKAVHVFRAKYNNAVQLGEGAQAKYANFKEDSIALQSIDLQQAVDVLDSSPLSSVKTKKSKKAKKK